MKVSVNCNNRTCTADLALLELTLEQLLATIGEDQVMAALQYAIINKAQQEMRRLIRAGRDDDTIAVKLSTWTPFPRASRALAQRYLKEAMHD